MESYSKRTGFNIFLLVVKSIFLQSKMREYWSVDGLSFLFSIFFIYSSEYWTLLTHI